MVLLKKMLRDMRKSKGQFIAILIMGILGVFVFAGLDSTQQGIEKNKDVFFQESNMGDAWIYATSVTNKDLKNIKKEEKVNEATKRFAFAVTHGNNQLFLTAQENNKISKPKVLKGEKYDPKGDGIWLAEPYANENNFKVGDKIKIEDHKLEIKGLVMSPENILFAAPQSSVPDYKTYGYGYVSPKTSKEIMGVFIPNQIVLTTKGHVAVDTKTRNTLEDKLGKRLLYSIDKKGQTSVASLDSRIEQLQKFSYIFPVVFFALALMTMLITMVRLIESQRIQIGTLLSQGYSKAQIKRHYISYGLWIGLVGGMLGLFLGVKLLPAFINGMFKNIFTFPNWIVEPTVGGYVSVGIIVVLCLMAVTMSCSRKLNDVPAEIMRNFTNKSGRHTIFEKTFIWKKLSFERIVLFRNMSRNRIRTLMGLIGVIGCVMLILTGLGMKDSQDETKIKLFSDEYNLKVVLNNPMNEKVTASDIGLKDTQPVQEGAIEILNGDKRESALYAVWGKGNLLGTEDENGNKIKSKKDGIVLSKEMADALNVKKGDNIRWRMPSEDWQKVKVADVVMTGTPQTIIISKDYWKEKQQEFIPTSYVIKENNVNIKKLENKEKVEKVIKKNNQQSDMEKVLESIDAIVYIFIGAAILLGVTILYNLGALNYSEMEREYATMKVMGFYSYEIRLMSFQENFFVTVTGILLGVPLGIKFVNYFMETISNKTISFFIKIDPSSFAIAIGITLACSFAVNLLLSIKINRINMVTSLKMVE